VTASSTAAGRAGASTRPWPVAKLKEALDENLVVFGSGVIVATYMPRPVTAKT
jgi:hypothetical protein